MEAFGTLARSLLRAFPGVSVLRFLQTNPASLPQYLQVEIFRLDVFTAIVELSAVPSLPEPCGGDIRLVISTTLRGDRCLVQNPKLPIGPGARARVWYLAGAMRRECCYGQSLRGSFYADGELLDDSASLAVKAFRGARVAQLLQAEGGLEAWTLAGNRVWCGKQPLWRFASLPAELRDFDAVVLGDDVGVDTFPKSAMATWWCLFSKLFGCSRRRS